MLWVLGREGVDDWTLGPFYIVVLQAVFLYKLEMWIMSTRIGRTLVDFHHRVVHRLTGGVQISRSMDGTANVVHMYRHTNTKIVT